MINRTAATLTKGDIVAVNLDFAATAGQAMVGLDPYTHTDSAAGYLFEAAIAVTTENSNRVCLVFLAGEGGTTTCLDNATGTFVIHGICDVNQNGANAGEFLYAKNAQVSAEPETLTEELALTTLRRYFGISLEASTGAQVKKAIWNAWGNFGGSGGDT